MVCGWPALASPRSRVSHNWRRPPWPSARPPSWRRSRREGGQAALRPTCGRLARPSSLPSRERRFDKGTLVRTLAAVVKEDPRPTRRSGPLEALLPALLAKNPEDRLSASKVRIWLRWLGNVAHATPPSEIPSTQALGGPITPTSPVTFHPTAPKTPVEPTVTAGRSPLEALASDPAMAPTVEPSTGTAAAQARTVRSRRPRRSTASPGMDGRRACPSGYEWPAAGLARGRLAAGAGGREPSDTGHDQRQRPDRVRQGPSGLGQGHAWRRHQDDPAGPVHQQGAHHPADPVNSQGACRHPAPTPSTRVVSPGGLPVGWRVFTNQAGNNRVGVPPGFQARTRQRYHATVLEEHGGGLRVFTVRSQTPSAPLPQVSRDYRAWARRNLAGFREVRYVEDQTYAGHRPAVLFEYQAVRDGRRVHVRHINVKGRTWGYNVEFIVPAGQWDASQRLARHFEHTFQPLG